MVQVFLRTYHGVLLLRFCALLQVMRLLALFDWPLEQLPVPVQSHLAWVLLCHLTI